MLSLFSYYCYYYYLFLFFYYYCYLLLFIIIIIILLLVIIIAGDGSPVRLREPAGGVHSRHVRCVCVRRRLRLYFHYHDLNSPNSYHPTSSRKASFARP